MATKFTDDEEKEIEMRVEVAVRSAKRIEEMKKPEPWDGKNDRRKSQADRRKPKAPEKKFKW